MERTTRTRGDSQPETGGKIPGSDGHAAFSLDAREPSLLPILLAVPHAGQVYPSSLLAMMRDPRRNAVRLEDRHIDRVARYAAAETGAGLLVAHAPRAMIDLNRSPDDVDHDMIRYGRDSAPRRTPPGWRTRNGLGLVPRRLPDVGELWTGQLGEADLAARLDGIHTPYHEALGAVLRRMRDRWGMALLLDIHSMPPLTPRPAGTPAPVCVLGDRFGASCDAGLANAAQEHLRDAGLTVAANRPYAGGYVLDRHAAPRQGIHALQIEFCRSLYLDSRLMEPTEGVAATGAILAGLIRRLSDEVALIGQGRRWDLAAE
ncbi:N-formylglutamate amidohydrolase [Caenibius sp. WL]|uniref:N-formylglutamate amidohydrolase n=1 Tax=Caenibius sp. WL TaxID=2872646 RepID=UPI001C99E8E7|nr:N-formylglutamate amidohydrolase [Caenibius sp. WL]QZP06853.1 N-formylglutamate amidohydrolase [Caenibius sp. WL]